MKSTRCTAKLPRGSLWTLPGATRCVRVSWCLGVSVGDVLCVAIGCPLTTRSVRDINIHIEFTAVLVTIQG